MSNLIMTGCEEELEKVYDCRDELKDEESYVLNHFLLVLTFLKNFPFKNYFPMRRKKEDSLNEANL